MGDDGFRKHPIGLGPYKFVSHTPGVELVVEAYEEYWRKMPHVKRLTLKSVVDASTRMAMLKKGEIDVAYYLDAAHAEEVKRDPKLRLAFSGGIGNSALHFLEGQWDPKSPWHDRRVRLAANYAIDRQAISEAETLGASIPTGSIIPREFEFALPIEPYPYDPVKAKQLLTEAGYPNGFDAGDLSPRSTLFRPRGDGGQLSGSGGHSDQAAHDGARGVSGGAERQAITRPGDHLAARRYGNAATRIEEAVVSTGTFAWGGYPDIDELFRQQDVETDRSKREAILHQIQQLMHERAMFAPIFVFVWPSGIGPRVEESGLWLIKPYPWAAPYEEVRLRKP